jgi:hypothetical protein
MPKSPRKETVRKPRTRAAGKPASAPMVDLEEAIRVRAYHIAEQRGAPGDPVLDWLRAEREVREGTRRS